MQEAMQTEILEGIRPCRTAEEIRRTFPVMRQLRPHLSEDGYVEQVTRMASSQDFHVAAAYHGGKPVAVAGYRFVESLSWGRFLYVDDLATEEAERSLGHGANLLAWLVSQARQRGCGQFHLDSGVQRHAAHRFYLRERMDITCFHFARSLEP
jgi:GNAT superfamily N-acetyltransferase